MAEMVPALSGAIFPRIPYIKMAVGIVITN